MTLHIPGVAARILLTNMEGPEGKVAAGAASEAGDSDIVEVTLKPCQAVVMELCQNGVCFVPVQNLWYNGGGLPAWSMAGNEKRQIGLEHSREIDEK